MNEHDEKMGLDEMYASGRRCFATEVFKSQMAHGLTDEELVELNDGSDEFRKFDEIVVDALIKRYTDPTLRERFKDWVRSIRWRIHKRRQTRRTRLMEEWHKDHDRYLNDAHRRYKI